jgi:predicted transposase YbfD/YdcC
MGCQREIAADIVEHDADYLLALKGNQGRIHEDVELLFSDLRASRFSAYEHDYARSVNKGHGRIETRECWAISESEVLRGMRDAQHWDSLTTVVMVRAERHMGSEKMVEDRYFLSSLPGNAKRLLAATRAHWGIENDLHWVLHIAFREDECRVRKDHGDQNLATLRHIALNLLKQEKTLKIGIKAPESWLG